MATRRKVIQSISALLAGFGFCGGSGATAAPQARRQIICFLGEWGTLRNVATVVEAFGKGFTLDSRYSLAEPDGRMRSAFIASIDRVARTFSAEDWARIERHNTVAYVLSPPLDRGRAMGICADALDLTARLIKAGATAVQCENAGVAHGLDHWLALARTHSIREAWVRRPIRDDDALYSCGMHLLGLPDIECIGSFEELEAVRWIDALADKCVSGKTIGNLFSFDKQTPERRIQRVPCKRYEEEEMFFNPYGYIRVHE